MTDCEDCGHLIAEHRPYGCTWLQCGCGFSADWSHVEDEDAWDEDA